MGTPADYADINNGKRLDAIARTLLSMEVLAIRTH